MAGEDRKCNRWEHVECVDHSNYRNDAHGDHGDAGGDISQDQDNTQRRRLDAAVFEILTEV